MIRDFTGQTRMRALTLTRTRTRAWAWLRILPVALLMSGLGLVVACGGDGAGDGDAGGSTLSVSETLGGAAEAGFLRADTVRTFTFPEDHGAVAGSRRFPSFACASCQDLQVREISSVR